MHCRGAPVAIGANQGILIMGGPLALREMIRWRFLASLRSFFIRANTQLSNNITMMAVLVVAVVVVAVVVEYVLQQPAKLLPQPARQKPP
jgi:hypothetical protein